MSGHDRSNRSRSTHRNPSLQLTRQIPVSSSEALFTIDRRGDIQNLQYGGIDRYKVPKYRTVGFGRLIGLDRRHRITSKTDAAREVDDQSLDTSSKNHSFPLLLRHSSTQASSHLIRNEPLEQNEFAVQRDYVALGKKRRRLSRQDNSHDLSLNKSELLGDVESESQSSSDGEAFGSTRTATGQSGSQNAYEILKNHPDNQKYLELRRQTEHDPGNAKAWLDFILHQERYIALTSGMENQSLRPPQQRAITEMRVSLYEKAMASVKDETGKDKLILGLMDEGAKIWDTNKQLKEWESVLNDKSSVDLWFRFLNFYQCNGVIFSYEKCLEVYTKILAIISNFEGERHDINRIYLTLRLTTFIFEAGFSERSIAIWQAMLEYNLFNIKRESDDMKDFEAFWDSEALRVGEEGAKGWRAEDGEVLPSREDELLPQLNKQSLFSDWGRVEIQRSNDGIMPARTLDETIEDDPYRVVLFSDVEDFIFRPKSPRGKILLKQALLKFCKLPPLSDDGGGFREWWTDPFLCHAFSSTGYGLLTDTDTMFAPVDSCLHIWNHSKIDSKTLLSFATRALTQMAKLDRQDDGLTEYTIALRMSQDPAGTRKFTRGLLKQRPNSLLLYNAYALVEAYDLRTDSASNVWATALSMVASFDASHQIQKFALWHSWVWHLVERHSYSHALKLLVDAMPADNLDGDKLRLEGGVYECSTSQRLRADAYFREQVANSLESTLESFPELTDLYAMFKYIQNENGFDAAVQVYRSSLSLLDPRSHLRVVESVHQLRARFLHFHATHSKTGYQPSKLVAILGESKTAFPNNSLFFDLHDRYLQRAGLNDRLRNRDVREVDTVKGVLTSIYSIQSEISRPLYSGSTLYSVRRLFTRTTSVDSDLRYCPAVWQSWIEFEATAGSSSDTSGKKARDVYLAALRTCPWNKRLYLSGAVVETLRADLGTNELERVYRSMVERGLRIRYNLADITDMQD